MRASVSSGEVGEEAEERMRRYEANKDLVVFKVASTSLWVLS